MRPTVTGGFPVPIPGIGGDSVDALAYVVVDTAAVIVIVLDQAGDESTAIHLVDAVGQIGGPFGAVPAEPVCIAPRVSRDGRGVVTPVVVDGHGPSYLGKTVEGFAGLEYVGGYVGGAKEDLVEDPGQSAADGVLLGPYQSVL